MEIGRRMPKFGTKQIPMNTTLRAFIFFIGLGLGAITLLALRPSPQAATYQWKQFSTIESVVPAGLGRSRVITSGPDGQAIEKEMKNFYSIAGINFTNVALNDRTIVETITAYTADGWELFTVTTGVNSPAEDKGGTGIFITRYLFRKAV
jgi:hypothetical protein